ncbi:hypothetical protein EXT67_20455 [Pectobacterium atrosepticum]|uniref:Uncharacterized protein n=1 Tax=Pectobacterium phage phiTE TaxID=1116482 RepID=K9L5L2_9CAUD|nr:hypothetical protein [Pectobacterium atrosepticum]YP_007392568.1 hypothetical protein phiTE_106 [Pectobacterium phage phiTE]AEZ66272.1 hypothetical protein phiTE_106 [Pectobacterium phage phiTE]ARB11710.1 hypothetical protein CB7_152 [Pectobacterium phage vB_PatM_CB7]MCL6318678.1 hypothetical protein [Pectobacterium atrosepticum]
MYTIISYRENGQVFRGGYCEGRTDSDFSIQTTRSGSDAIEFLAQAIYLDKVAQNRDLNKDYDFTEAAEITLGINGYFGTEHSVDMVSDEFYEKDLEERNDMLKQAQLIAAAKYDNRLRSHREEKQREAAQARRTAEEQQEAFERKQLSRLKEKYGE